MKPATPFHDHPLYRIAKLEVVNEHKVKVWLMDARVYDDPDPGATKYYAGYVERTPEFCRSGIPLEIGGRFSVPNHEELKR